MKNRLLALSRKHGTMTRRGLLAFTRQLQMPERQDSCIPTSWQMLSRLLESQAETRGICALEPAYPSVPGKAEALDMALFLTLARLQGQGVIPDELPGELCAQRGVAPTAAIAAADAQAGKNLEGGAPHGQSAPDTSVS